VQLLLLCGWLGSIWLPAALGQAEGNNPPTVSIIRWEVYRPNPPASRTPDYIPQPPGNPPVYDEVRDGGDRSVVTGSGSDSDGAFLHEERDRVLVTFRIEDADWLTQQQDQEEVDEGAYLRVRALTWPWRQAVGTPSREPPNIPPVPDMTDDFFGPPYSDEGYKPNPGETSVDVQFEFRVPEFNGNNQARLRGQIDWDVRWVLIVDVSNEETPPETEQGGLEGVTSDEMAFVAMGSPGLSAPNAPPFADAGPDRTVPVNTTVVLDGSRTFDAYNVGFDVGDVDIYEKDLLTFTWEWISGPARVDPVPEDPNDPTNPRATVIFDDDETGVYVYRLLVDDNVNALPSTDSVTLTVVESLPAQNPPVAVIAGPANAVPVGAIITLYGDEDPAGNTLSYDPDGDDLSYRWQQTNELGGPLSPDELQNAFQPLSGLTEPRSTWQALTPGTFYFRLLVDDGSFRASTTFSVEVIETATSGAASQEPPEGELAYSSSESGRGHQGNQEALPGLCGSGLALPLLVVPSALFLMRRRIH